MNESSFTILLKFIGNHNVRTINIIPHYISANDSTNNCTSVNSDPHIEFLKIEPLSDSLYSFNHCKAHVYNILSLLEIIPLIAIDEAQHNIAISNGVYFVNIVLEAELIELFEKLPQHLHHFYWSVLIRI